MLGIEDAVRKTGEIRAALAYPAPYPTGGTYGMLLTWHLEEWGTDPEAGTEKGENQALWDPKDFAARIHPEGFDTFKARRNLGNWINPNGAPPKKKFEAARILEVLFGENPHFDKWRYDLRNARIQYYEKRERKTKTDTPPRRELSTSNNSISDASQDISSSSAQQFEVGLSREVPSYNEDIFDIALHHPPQGGSHIGFELLATVSLGVRTQSVANVSWTFGIRRLRILDRSKGCQVVKGSTLAKAGIRREGSSWLVENPDDPTLPMRGDQLPDPLACMQHDGISPAMEVVLRAQCDDTDVTVTSLDASEPISSKRSMVLKRFLQASIADGEGRVFLGEARLHWSVPG